MATRDGQFGLIISGFRRLDFNDAVGAMHNIVDKLKLKLMVRELGTGNSIVHGLAEDDAIDPEILINLSSRFPNKFLTEDVNKNHETVVDILLRKGKSAHILALAKEGLLSIKDYRSKGGNCLHIVATRDNPKLVRLLIKHGADTHEKNTEGLLPVDVARRYAAFQNVDTFESIDYQQNYNNEVNEPSGFGR